MKSAQTSSPPTLSEQGTSGMHDDKAGLGGTHPGLLQHPFAWLAALIVVSLCASALLGRYPGPYVSLPWWRT